MLRQRGAQIVRCPTGASMTASVMRAPGNDMTKGVVPDSATGCLSMSLRPSDTAKRCPVDRGLVVALVAQTCAVIRLPSAEALELP
jgi:hypothetical protein